MNRLIGMCLLMALSACAAPAANSTANSDGANSKGESDQPDTSLHVLVGADGRMSAGGYYFNEADLPDLIKQWHVNSVRIYGVPGTSFGDLMKIEKELQSAGVAEVKIMEQQ